MLGQLQHRCLQGWHMGAEVQVGFAGSGCSEVQHGAICSLLVQTLHSAGAAAVLWCSIGSGCCSSPDGSLWHQELTRVSQRVTWEELE